MIDSIYWGERSPTADYSAYIRTVMLGQSGLEEAVTHWSTHSIVELKERLCGG